MFIFTAPVIGAGLAALAAVMFWIAAEEAERLVLGVPRQWIAVVIVDAGWFVLLARLGGSRILAAAVAAHAISRAGAIALTWVSRPAATGFPISSRLSTMSALGAIAEGLAASFLAGFRGALLLIAACYLTLRIIQQWCYKYRGGIDTAGFEIARSALQILILLIWSLLF